MKVKDNEKKKPTGTYASGYCRPPEHTRFQAGEGGNKKGRRAGRPSFAQVVREEVARVLKIAQGDKVIHVEKDRALVRKAFSMAMNGNVQAMKLAIGLMGKAQDDPAVETPPEVPLTKDELAVLAMMAKAKGASS